MTLTNNQQYLIAVFCGALVGGTIGLAVGGIIGAALGLCTTGLISYIFVDPKEFAKSIRKNCGEAIPPFSEIPEMSWWIEQGKYLLLAIFYISLLWIDVLIGLYPSIREVPPNRYPLDFIGSFHFLFLFLMGVCCAFVVVKDRFLKCDKHYYAKGRFMEFFLCGIYLISPFAPLFLLFGVLQSNWRKRGIIAQWILLSLKKTAEFLLRLALLPKKIFIAIHSELRVMAIVDGTTGYLLGFWLFQNTHPLLGGIGCSVVALILGYANLFYIREKVLSRQTT